MKKLILPYGLALTFALTPGCAEVNYVPTQPSPRDLSARSVQEVEIFTTSRPERRYTEVGIFTAEAFRQDHGGSPLVRNSQLIEMIRERAAHLGCDGVILQQGGENTYQGTCIVYGEAKPQPAAEQRPAQPEVVPAAAAANPESPPEAGGPPPCPGLPGNGCR